MNTLSYCCTADHGLSIELLIDGLPLAELAGLDDTAIPYYMFEGDLPLGSWGADDHSIKIIAVCTCGDAGCGSDVCRVVREGNVVVFRDFNDCVNPNLVQAQKEGKEFRVTSVNYDSVIADIMKQIADHQART